METFDFHLKYALYPFSNKMHAPATKKKTEQKQAQNIVPACV